MKSENFYPDMGEVKKDFNGGEYKWAYLDKGSSISVHGGTWHIKTFHPYDMTEYHYAYSEDGHLWHVCRLIGRTPRRITTFTGSDPHLVVAKMRELDAPLKAHIDVS